MENGVMIANVELMLEKAGINFIRDDANKTLSITVQ